MAATLDGIPCFGVAVHITPQANPDHVQINAYPGINGLQVMDMGSRGRVFQVTGLMIGSTPGDVEANEVSLENFADGLPHLLISTAGGIWQNVTYRREYHPTGKFVFLASGNGWGRSYSLLLHGLL